MANPEDREKRIEITNFAPAGAAWDNKVEIVRAQDGTVSVVNTHSIDVNTRVIDEETIAKLLNLLSD